MSDSKSQEDTKEVELDNVIERNYNKLSSLLNNVVGINVNSESELKSIIIMGNEFITVEKANLHISELIYLTYRCGFEPIPKVEDGPQPIQFFPSIIFNKSTLVNNFTNLKSLLDKDNFTSDSGWGCMIRTSQNLLANTLSKLNPNKLDEILDLFQDNFKSQYSLHNFIKVVNESPLKIKPGQWFGPNAASISIKKLIENTENTNLIIPQVFISDNCDLYDDELIELLITRPLLILFPVRLGIDQVNKYYYQSILQLLSMKYSIGISGGKPSSSFYFIGYEKESSDLIYFDPHFSQVCQTPINKDSYHTTNYNKLKIENLDPSMMIGIVINDKREYCDFKNQCIELKNKIIHFHPEVQQEFNNQSWEEIQEVEDDFVNLNIRNEDDEFVQV